MGVSAPDHPVVLSAPEGANDVSQWEVALRHGTQEGLGARVMGRNVWVHVKGSMSFDLKHLDDSKKYDELKNTYAIRGGVDGFWSWINQYHEEHKDELHQVFNEIANQGDVHAKVDIDIQISGTTDGLREEAEVYVEILEITDASGNTYNAVSSSAPQDDTGARDKNDPEKKMPTKDNKSKIGV